jgi:hypothetical protein
MIMHQDNPATEILHLGLSHEPLSLIDDWNEKIWRYMDLAKFVSMLQNDALFFSVVAMLGDDLEAAPPTLPKSDDAFQKRKACSIWSLNRCINFASCWHRSDDESAAMWMIYAGGDQGIAIQSTLDGLRRAFPPATEEDANKILKIGLVDYIDPSAEVPLPRIGNTYQSVLLKRMWYASEREMRIICSPPDNWIEPSSLHESGGFKKAGVWVHCGLRELIQAVIVAPKAPSYLEPAVREIFRRFGFNPAIVKASRLNEAVVWPDPAAVRAVLKSMSRPDSAAPDETSVDQSPTV